MKRTLITCATSEIGSAVAKSLTQDELLLTGRNMQALAELKQTIMQENQRVNDVALDFFCDESIERAGEKILAHGALDKVVFIIPRIPASSEVFPDSDTWLTLYQDYFIKPLSLLKRLFEAEAINVGAKIVFISGLSSRSALTGYAANNGIRLAWLGQAKTMALALGEKRISVNSLSLGGVMTASYTDKMKQKAKANQVTFEEQMAQEVDNVPLNKYASVQDVVDAVQGLVGPMANHMTGQNILLDGGFFRGY